MERRKPSWEMSQKELLGPKNSNKLWVIIIGVIVGLVGLIVVLKYLF